MTRKKFIEFAFTNDISFRYNGQEYYIFQGNDSCICGKFGDEEDMVFDKCPDVIQNINDMLENWEIDGKALKDLISTVEFKGN